MKKLMFYCQHILGIGHLVRSIEIVRGLTKDYQICFINGGEVIKEFPMPAGVEVINLPAIKTDTEFAELQAVDDALSLTEVKQIRRDKLLNIFDQFQPNIFMIELFPFGRLRFSFEIAPLLKRIKSTQGATKVVSSLRDIVVVKPHKTVKHEAKVCRYINQYFDMVLVHGDPKFAPIEETFTRVNDLNCEIHYTGYVVQQPPKNPVFTAEDKEILNSKKPLILVSVGSGRFGHDLLDCVVNTAPLLEAKIPHHIQIFTGPFMPESKFQELQTMIGNSKNISIRRYTPYLLNYMQKADLSISMSGYNTTMNVLTTGVRAMIMPFTGNEDREQSIRAEKLSDLGIVKMISPDDLQPDLFAEKMINHLREEPSKISFDFAGVEKTASLLNGLGMQEQAA
ncbi:MAG: glycosyl transferase [Goleter apudmare HA4340-LM2]|jgi:predicted glycosyltransferase|nr:glycosyl transferase [Goleter apudmare HA4340-LM2]